MFHRLYLRMSRKNEAALLRLAQRPDAAQALTQYAIASITKGHLPIAAALFREERFYSKFLETPERLTDILIAIPPKHSDFLLDLLVQKPIMAILFNHTQGVQWMHAIAKAHPVLQAGILDYPDCDLRLASLYQRLWETEQVAAYIGKLAVLNKRFAEALFENHYTQDDPDWIKAFTILSQDPQAIHYFIEIIQAHALEAYLKRRVPHYQIDFYQLPLERIGQHIFYALTASHYALTSSPR